MNLLNFLYEKDPTLFTDNSSRSLVDDLYGSQPETERVRLLHQPQVSGILLPLLQGRAERQATELDRQGRPARL